MNIEVDTKDIQKALDYLNKQHKPTKVVIQDDMLGRLLIKAGSVTITIYNADTQKFPTVTSEQELL